MKSTKVRERIELTQKGLKEVLNYDPITGIFTWGISNSNRVKVGDFTGTLRNDGYIAIGVIGRSYLAHRLAWLYMTGEMPTYFIDHINGNRADNRFCNLREATNQQNMQNLIKPQERSTTGFLGVSFDKPNRKYVAKIRINGKNRHLGSFATPEEASVAYLSEKRKHHEFCTI